MLLEVFNNLFMAIAEQMGVTLANTAYSVNIKERLDFSCALFDAAGNLIANAPHMPVHLGSMGESVKTIIDRRAGTMRRGDVFVLNAPYNGGTHLPDVTVIAPVFLDGAAASPSSSSPRAATTPTSAASRPGSMPPDSTHVEEEGVLLDNVQLVARGTLPRGRDARDCSSGGRYPARNVEQNLADLRAQVAACAKGAEELAKMVGHFGAAGRARLHAARAGQRRGVGAPRARRADRRHASSYEMDSGARIRVTIRVDRARREATIDFTGTSAQQPTNFNAPSAVCKAAVLYVFRTLVDDEIPMNAGCLKPLTHRHSGGLDAEPALSGGGRRGQRRDVAGDHRLPVRRARRARGVAGHDEQLHVRQRRATSTTRRSPAARARDPISTARASCRRT